MKTFLLTPRMALAVLTAMGWAATAFADNLAPRLVPVSHLTRSDAALTAKIVEDSQNGKVGDVRAVKYGPAGMVQFVQLELHSPYHPDPRYMWVNADNLIYLTQSDIIKMTLTLQQMETRPSR